MRIGELASAAGVSVRSLRYYEEQGLLTSVRNSGGQRVYADGDVARVRFLQSLYAVGMPSRSIVELLPCFDDPNVEHTEQAWAKMGEQRDRIASEIAELSRIQAELDRLIDGHRRSAA
jgi:DNA-binding transcriptional MerR regulator